MQILISAGEASGEMYGAQLIEALHRSDLSLTFFGAGGERMRTAGCDIIVDAGDLAVVGITEIFSHLPKILDLYKKLIRAADERRPALAVVIDSPAFNWRVARQMRKRGIPVVYYVCPQFWAWRQGRVKLLRKYVNKALVIFPFEEKFYRDRGVDAIFVGHPLADLDPPAISREEYAEQAMLGGQALRLAPLAQGKPSVTLDPAKPWITLMPGSRRKEVRMNLPTMLEAADRLGGAYQFLLPVARTLDPQFVKSLVETRLAASVQWKQGKDTPQLPNSPPFSPPQTETGQDPSLHLVSEALPALHHSRAAIVASGTATVEAALMGTPFVMVYRVSPLTYALGKPRIKVPHYAMVNLIAGRQVVPELVQDRFTAANIVVEVNRILPDGPARDEMLLGLGSVRERLKKPDGDQRPADRAAGIILDLLRG